MTWIFLAWKLEPRPRDVEGFILYSTIRECIAWKNDDDEVMTTMMNIHEVRNESYQTDDESAVVVVERLDAMAQLVAGQSQVAGRRAAHRRRRLNGLHLTAAGRVITGVLAVILSQNRVNH